MKVAIYYRVSKAEQHTENQELVLPKFASLKGWEYQEFWEKESTRKTRPVKQEVLNLLRKRQFDGLLVMRMTRWARTLSELIMELTEFQEKGIGFYSYTENLDFTTSVGRLHIHILAAFGEFERERIREQTLEGLARARAQGKKLGRPRKTPL